jgi:hypothetical protein
MAERKSFRPSEGVLTDALSRHVCMTRRPIGVAPWVFVP